MMPYTMLSPSSSSSTPNAGFTSASALRKSARLTFISATESDTNNDALVIRLSRGGDVVLFATEPEEPAQEWLLEQRDEAGLDLRADVLKVPHHGAATSVAAFFDAVAAPVAVVSVGENTYGHPVPSTLQAIAETGAEIWRTDQHGTVTVTFEGGLPTVTADR